MSSIFDTLIKKELITDCPSYMKNNIHYECIMGSVAYGVSNDTSDIDVYGFCMPSKHILFPYINGNIVGFGKSPETFNQYQKHHIKDKDTNKEYDICIYNIVRFFQLCMENNPNMIDALFVPTRCVLTSTSIGNHVRENRKLFLSKRVWHKFKGYAYSQLHKMKNKTVNDFVIMCNKYNIPYDLPLKETLDAMKAVGADNDTRSCMLNIINKIETGGKRSKRILLIAKYGYDVKFAYHVVRLLDECQMILEEGDLDITRSREHLKAIRKGEVSVDSIIDYFDKKLIVMEGLYSKSDLPYAPNEDNIRQVLFECIEMHYGSLSNVGVKKDDDILRYINAAQTSLNKAIGML